MYFDYLIAYIDIKITKIIHSRCECHDYLFDIATQMKSVGLDPSEVPVPSKGAYLQ